MSEPIEVTFLVVQLEYNGRTHVLMGTNEIIEIHNKCTTQENTEKPRETAYTIVYQ